MVGDAAASGAAGRAFAWFTIAHYGAIGVGSFLGGVVAQAAGYRAAFFVSAAVVMVTWRRGREIVTRNRNTAEGSLQDFLYRVRMADPPLHRVRNVAIYLSPDKETTPLALKADVEHHGVFHDKVLIVSIDSVSVPRVEPADQFSVQGTMKAYHDTGDSGQKVERHFCPDCGSPILTEVAVMPGVAIIKAGTLDDPSWLKPAMQIYCDSAQPWVDLAGEMQRFPKMPG